MKTIQLMSLLSLLGLVSCGNGLKGFNEAVAQRAARYEVETFQTRSGKPLAITLIKHGSLEIYYDGPRGLEYIERLCELELALERKKRGHGKKIGF